MHNADHEQIAGIIAEFLRTNGIDAQRGLAKGIGATSGIPEAIKTVGLAIKVGKAISSFLAKRARRNVRKSMALVTVTLQSTVVPATAGYPYTALQAVELVAEYSLLMGPRVVRVSARGRCHCLRCSAPVLVWLSAT